MASTTTQTARASVLNIRPLNDRTKPEYQNSFGTFSRAVGPFGRWNLWNVVDKVNQIWSELEVHIVTLLEAKASEIRPPRKYRGPKDPSHVLRCYMVGLDRAHASPHVAIICDQKWLCKRVRDIVLRSGLLQERGWAGFLKLQGEIRQPGGTSPTLRALGQPTRHSTNPSVPPLNATYAADSEEKKLPRNNVAISLRSGTLPKTLCGTRIAISGADGLVSVATLGGLIELEGQVYGLTVSHAFLPKPPIYDNSEAEPGSDSDSEASVFAFDENDLDPSLRPPSPVEDVETRLQRLDTPATENLSSQSLPNDLPSIPLESPISRMGYRMDSPVQALRDSDSSARACATCRIQKIRCNGARPVCQNCAISQMPCSYLPQKIEVSGEEIPPVNRKDQFGAAFKTLPSQNSISEPSYLPWIFGAFETFENNSVFEFQWALISLGHEHLHKFRKVNDFCAEGFDQRLCITSVSDMTIPDGKNILLATTRGGVLGVGISSKSSIKIASSDGYHALGTIQLDRAEEGDCGSWAVDLSNGKLLGMLVASSDIAREAYILPAREIFADIMRVSHKSVALPSSEVVDKLNQPTSMELRTEYPYRPLRMNEIRVLTVLPGKAGTSLECHLSVRNLDDPGEYEALSYAWETWEPSSSISLHHQSINVTPGLASALETFRLVDRPRHLWVDALCINQQDAEETSNQVMLMADIMERATEVCIWLGEEDEDSQWAFSSYHRILRLHDIHDLISHKSMLRQVLALSGLAKRAWFHRRWCVQDVCGAKKATLYCGTYTLEWDTFADVITLLWAYIKRSQDFARDLVEWNWRGQRSPLDDLMCLGAFVEVVNNVFRRTDSGQILERVVSLETLVCDLVWLNVTIPHDSIYSLLSLAKDANKLRGLPPSLNLKTWTHPILSPTVRKAVEAFRKPLERQREKLRRIEIDYTKPFTEVCRDFIHLAISGSNSLDIICRPWAPAVADLPSWVSTVSKASMITQMDKRFVRINADELVGRSGPGRSKVYEASGPSHPIFLLTARELCVEGFILDKVRAKQTPAWMGNIPPGWMDFLGWTEVSTLPPESSWRLLVANRDPNGRLPPTHYRLALQQVFQQIRPSHSFNLSQRFQRITSDEGLNVSQQLAVSTAHVQEFLHRVQSVVWRRRLIMTEEHRSVGLAPAETQEGDVVAILYGCSVPVILRQTVNPEGEGMAFTLIGECYIDEMMDGRALDIKKAAGTKTQTLVII